MRDWNNNGKDDESGFRDVMDNQQMGKDFGLFELAKQLDFSILQRQQKIQLLQLLLDTFSVDNPMPAEEHYKSMEINDAYYQYMTHCFGKIGNDGVIFWRIFGSIIIGIGRKSGNTVKSAANSLQTMRGDSRAADVVKKIGLENECKSKKISAYQLKILNEADQVKIQIGSQE